MPGHRHPRRRYPVDRSQVEAELAQLYRQAGFQGRPVVGWPNDLTSLHERNHRRYAQVFPGEGDPKLGGRGVPRFELAEQARWLPREHRRGLLAHEVGHAIDPGSEKDADRAAHEHLGVKIAYDRRWPGKGLQVALSNPSDDVRLRELERLANEGSEEAFLRFAAIAARAGLLLQGVGDEAPLFFYRAIGRVIPHGRARYALELANAEIVAAMRGWRPSVTGWTPDRFFTEGTIELLDGRGRWLGSYVLPDALTDQGYPDRLTYEEGMRFLVASLADGFLTEEREEIADVRASTRKRPPRTTRWTRMPRSPLENPDDGAFLEAQARLFARANTPWLSRNPPSKKPTVTHYWTGERIEVPSEIRRSRWVNGYVIYRGPSMIDGSPIICIASGFIEESSNEKTGPMIQTWILREDVDPQTAVWTGEDKSICGDCVHRGEIGRHKAVPWVNRKRVESAMIPGVSFMEGGEPGKRARMMPKSVGRSCYVVVSYAPLRKWKQFHSGEFPIVPFDGIAELFRGAFPVRIGSYGDPVAVPVGVWHQVLKNQDRWTGYTSQWKRKEAQPYKDFLMASVSTPEELREAHKRGWRTFRIGRRDEPMIAGVEIVCPATPEGGFRVQCDSCNLCMGLAKEGARSIVTAPHGSGAAAHELRGRRLPIHDPKKKNPRRRRR